MHVHLGVYMDEQSLARSDSDALATSNSAAPLIKTKKHFFRGWKFISMKPRLFHHLHHVRPRSPSLTRRLSAGMRTLEQKKEITETMNAWEVEKRGFDQEFEIGKDAVRRHIAEMSFPERSGERQGPVAGLKLVYQVEKKGYEFRGQKWREGDTESVSWQTAYEEER